MTIQQTLLRYTCSALKCELCRVCLDCQVCGRSSTLLLPLGDASALDFMRASFKGKPRQNSAAPEANKLPDIGRDHSCRRLGLIYSPQSQRSHTGRHCGATKAEFFEARAEAALIAQLVAELLAESYSLPFWIAIYESAVHENWQRAFVHFRQGITFIMSLFSCRQAEVVA